MKTNRLPLLLASLSFAVAFIASCSTEDDGEATPDGALSATTSDALSFYEYDPESSSSRPSSSSFVPDAIGGEFTEPITLVFDQNMAIMTMSGVIAATNNNMISEVVINDNYLISLLKPDLILPAPTVSLDGIIFPTQCNVRYRYSIIVKFDNGQSLSMVKTLTPECSIVSSLNTWPFTLSRAGRSYADLDTYETYLQSTAFTIPEDIDLIAFCGTACTENAIYSPYFLSDRFEDNMTALLPLHPYIENIIKNATTQSDIEVLSDVIWDYIDFDEELEKVAVVKDTGFLVVSSDWEIYAVFITNTGDQSVDLNAVHISW